MTENRAVRAQTTTCPHHFHMALSTVCLVSLSQWRCHCLPRQPPPLLYLPLLSESFVLMTELNLSFYNIRLLFLSLTTAGRKIKVYSCSPYCGICMFRDNSYICFQSPFLLVKPSSFALSSPIVVFTLSALYLTVISWLRFLLKCSDIASERGLSSLPIGGCPPETIDYYPRPLFPLAISNPPFQMCVKPLPAHPHLQIL